MLLLLLLPPPTLALPLRALPLLPASLDARFTIVGDGDMIPKLTALAKELGVEDRVRFLGFVSDEVKLRTLTEGILDNAEAERFLALVQRLPELRAEELAGLTVSLPQGKLARNEHRGIFGWPGGNG